MLSQTAASASLFSFIPPVITGSSPSSVPVKGVLLTLLGTNFGIEPTSVLLLLNGNTVTSFTIEVFCLCWCRDMLLY